MSAAPVITEADAHAAIVACVRRASIGDAVPLISPSFTKPMHMRPLLRLIRRMHKAARGEGPPVFACLSAPPQVGKTETLQHGIAWWLARDPSDFLAYVSYGQDIADTKSRRIRDLARLVDADIRTDSRAVDQWRTSQGGGLLARGLRAGITGHSAVSAIFIDDPYMNRAQAESRAYNEALIADFDSSIWTRRHPRTSFLVNHTRWNEGDLTGVLVKRGWERHVIPAISPEGLPLWPESGRDLAFWDQTRRGTSEYDWWGMFMGEPRPREGRLFKGASFYERLPMELQVTIGIDFAYSERAQADWSVAVALGYDQSRSTYYVLDVLRRQVLAPAFAAELQTWRSRWPGAGMHAYIGGTEKGVVDFFGTQGIRIDAHPASSDKFSRATGTSATWNDNRVLLPSVEHFPGAASWVDAFVGTVLDFPSGRHDDDIDALVAAHDHAARTSGAVVQPPRPEKSYERSGLGAQPGVMPATAPRPLMRKRWE